MDGWCTYWESTLLALMNTLATTAGHPARLLHPPPLPVCILSLAIWSHLHVCFYISMATSKYIWEACFVLPPPGRHDLVGVFLSLLAFSESVLTVYSINSYRGGCSWGLQLYIQFQFLLHMQFLSWRWVRVGTWPVSVCLSGAFLFLALLLLPCCSSFPAEPIGCIGTQSKGWAVWRHCTSWRDWTLSWKCFCPGTVFSWCSSKPFAFARLFPTPAKEDALSLCGHLHFLCCLIYLHWW